MPKVEINQESFVSGELGPPLFGRTDIPQWESALALCENFILKPSGAAVTCPGTEFINDAKFTAIGSIDSDLLLYLKANGTDGSTQFVDSSLYQRTVTAKGNSVIDTAQSVFGGASALFGGGASDQLWVPDDDVWAFVGVDFTIKMRVRFSTVAPGTYALLSQWSDATDRSWYVAYQTNSGGGTDKRILFYHSQNGFTEVVSEVDITATPLLTDTWYELAFVRSGSSLYYYLNGVRIGTGAVSQAFYNSTRRLNISGYSDGTGANQTLNSWVDEVQIWKRALHTGDTYDEADEELDESGNPFSIRTYGRSRLVPFIFSRNDAYIMEVGEGYFRFYTNGALVEA